MYVGRAGVLYNRFACSMMLIPAELVSVIGLVETCRFLVGFWVQR